MLHVELYNQVFDSDLINIIGEFSKLDNPFFVLDVDKLIEVLHSSSPDYLPIFLLIDREKVIGYASGSIYYSYTETGKQLYIDELFITAKERSKGYGGYFINEIKAWAKEQAVEKLKLITRPDNLKAQSFYEKNGGVKKEKVNYTFVL
jgi:GNAT superfamily N-acetyltransferase